MGEPAGIGPEVAVKAWAALNGRIGGRALRLIGSKKVFEDAVTLCGLDAAGVSEAIIDIGAPIEVTPGQPSAENSTTVTSAIEEGVKRVTDGSASALVTAPINKAVLANAGFGFPGHTEFLASLTNVPRAVMMLVSEEIDPPLRVIPLTVHVALKEAIASLSAQAIVETAEIILSSLECDYAITRPRLAIAGLNPHAGEEGIMGFEDGAIIAPAIDLLQAHGHRVTGPHPPDTLFHEDARKNYDAVLCMYHDQALIPIKTLAFWSGVNVTLGLPIVRTSPDHGTAFDIAGEGCADARSMIAAIRQAAAIADRRGL
jgi:4-hydroxythreonine-4-phosphate dehydrogenase